MKQTLTVITFFSIFLCVSFYVQSEENRPECTIEHVDTFAELKKQFKNYDTEQIFESDEDDDFKIIFDLEDIYPLVDYDTICAECEIQDFLNNAVLIIDSMIPDVPQAPESVGVIVAQEYQEDAPHKVEIEENVKDLPRPKKRSWFGKKSKKNKVAQ